MKCEAPQKGCRCGSCTCDKETDQEFECVWDAGDEDSYFHFYCSDCEEDVRFNYYASMIKVQR